MCLLELWFSLSTCPGVGSYVNSIFSFLRHLHTVLHSSFINLHSHQQSKSQCLLYVDFFDDGHSDWYMVIIHYSHTFRDDYFVRICFSSYTETQTTLLLYYRV